MDIIFRMDNKAYVFFWLDVYDPDEISEITRQMGLEPTQILSTGKSKAGGGTIPFSIWEVVSPLPETELVDQHIEALLGLLKERAEVVKALAEHHECGIHCQLTCYSTEDQPWQMPVWKPTVQDLAQLGLSITFELFYLGGQ